jgi:hypothetical protein
MTSDERVEGPKHPPGARGTPRGRRPSKRLLRAGAWLVGGMAFALPWAAVAAVPHPATTAQTAAGQVLVVPAGTRVIYRPSGPASGGTVVSGASTHAVTTTGGSAPPP